MAISKDSERANGCGDLRSMEGFGLLSARNQRESGPFLALERLSKRLSEVRLDGKDELLRSDAESILKRVSSIASMLHENAKPLPERWSIYHNPLLSKETVSEMRRQLGKNEAYLVWEIENTKIIERIRRIVEPDYRRDPAYKRLLRRLKIR